MGMTRPATPAAIPPKGAGSFASSPGAKFKIPTAAVARIPMMFIQNSVVRIPGLGGMFHSFGLDCVQTGTDLRMQGGPKFRGGVQDVPRVRNRFLGGETIGGRQQRVAGQAMPVAENARQTRVVSGYRTNDCIVEREAMGLREDAVVHEEPNALEEIVHRLSPQRLSVGGDGGEPGVVETARNLHQPKTRVVRDGQGIASTLPPRDRDWDGDVQARIHQLGNGERSGVLGEARLELVVGKAHGLLTFPSSSMATTWLSFVSSIRTSPRVSDILPTASCSLEMRSSWLKTSCLACRTAISREFWIASPPVPMMTAAVTAMQTPSTSARRKPFSFLAVASLMSPTDG